MDLISIHAPRGGSDGYGYILEDACNDFNPRSPWGERLCLFAKDLQGYRFQSTLPVGGATVDVVKSGLGGLISIHAPRGGSDPL